MPGVTRAAVPLLCAAGVRTLSLGVNTGSAPPGTPKFEPFFWRDPGSGARLMVFVHPGGYGGITRLAGSGAEVFLDPPDQCVTARGLGHWLCTSWRNDNTGGGPGGTLGRRGCRFWGRGGWWWGRVAGGDGLGGG